MASELIKDLKSKGPESLYVFFGDEYLVKEQLQELISEVLEPDLRDTNLITLDGANLDIGALSLHLFTPSLFGGPRVVVVEQTAVFMTKTDRRKLIDKVLASWKGNERKSAFRAFAQLLSIAGMGPEDLSDGTRWATELLGSSARTDEVEALGRLAQSFLAEGKKADAGTDEAALEEILRDPFPEGTILILTALEVNQRSKLFKAVKKRARVVECTVRRERYGKQTERAFFDERVRGELARGGKTISHGALEKMYARSGNDMRGLHSELQKLIAYMGDRQQATESDVEELFTDSHEAAFFDFAAQLRTADLSKCLPALHENLKIMGHPLQTLAVTANEFRKLMAARELLFTVFRSSWRPGMDYRTFQSVAKAAREQYPQLTAKGKLNLLSGKDYPLFLALKDAQRFPMEKLIRIMEAILEADIMMKSSRLGSASPQTIMENLVIRICAIAGPDKRLPGARSR